MKKERRQHSPVLTNVSLRTTPRLLGAQPRLSRGEMPLSSSDSGQWQTSSFLEMPVSSLRELSWHFFIKIRYNTQRIQPISQRMLFDTFLQTVSDNKELPQDTLHSCDIQFLLLRFIAQHEKREPEGFHAFIWKMLMASVAMTKSASPCWCQGNDQSYSRPCVFASLFSYTYYTLNIAQMALA